MWKKIAAAVGCGVLLWSGSPAMAAEQDAAWLYKEACLANVNDDRITSTNVDLFGPNYHWELDADGKILRDGSMRWYGNMSWDFTETSNNVTSHEDIPFYLEQKDGILSIYAQREHKWGKISLPGLPPELVNAWKTGSLSFIDDSMQAVKNVSLTSDTDKMQDLRIVMDAGKMMQVSEKYLGEGSAHLSAKEKQEQKELLANLAKALQGTDVTVDWVISKADRKTITISTDLTPLLRAYARNVINDMAAGKVKLSNDEREMMESLGYFSELKFYMTYKNTNQDENLVIPADVRKSAIELINLADIQKGVSEASQTGKKKG